MKVVDGGGIDWNSAVVSLSAEAARAEARVRELRQEILHLDERIEAVFGALLRLPARPAPSASQESGVASSAELH